MALNYMDKKKAFLSSMEYSKNNSKSYESNNEIEIINKNLRGSKYLNTSPNKENEIKIPKNGKEVLTNRDNNILGSRVNKFQFNKRLETKRMKTTSSINYTDLSLIGENEEKKTIINSIYPEGRSSINDSPNISKYGETKRKLEYNNKIETNNIERKSLKVDSNNLRELISNEEGMEIVKFLSPKLNKIKSKEQRLSNLYIKASEIMKKYKESNEELEQLIDTYKKKKMKMKKLMEDLEEVRKGQYEKELSIKEKEKELNDRENELLNELKTIEEEKRNIKNSYDKFKEYYEKMSDNLKSKANNIRRKLDQFSNIESRLKDRESQLNEREQYIIEGENELNKKINQFQIDRYENEIKLKEFEFQKEEFSLTSKDILEKYKSFKSIQDDITNQRENLMKYENEINIKNKENQDIYEKNKKNIEFIYTKEKEMEEKKRILDEKEKQINNLQFNLEEKIQFYNIKMEEIHRAQKELNEKEVSLRMKQNIEKDLDLKLAGLELSDSVLKKKMAFQSKQLMTEFKKLREKEKDLTKREEILKLNLI